MKPKQNKAERTDPKVIEEQLIPRLFVVGCILTLFSLCSLSYALFTAPSSPPVEDDNFSTPEEREVSSGISSPFSIDPNNHSHFYAISFIFASVGGACILTAWKKNKA
jgi:hypothetical protein